MAIFLDTGDNEVDLSLVEELLAHARLVGQLGEVNDEVPADEANDDGNDTLEDEDPAPARQAGTEGHRSSRLSLGRAVMDTEPGSSLDTVTLEKREEVTEDAGEGRRQHADEEKDGVALLELVTLVPARQEVSLVSVSILQPLR